MCRISRPWCGCWCCHCRFNTLSEPKINISVINKKMYQQLKMWHVSSLRWLLLLPSLFDMLSDLGVSWRVGGVCYDFPHSFSFLHHCLPTFLWTSFLYIGFTHIWLLRHLFMHCPCAYSCAYSCTACLLMDSLTVQYIRTEWTLLFCS